MRGEEHGIGIGVTLEQTRAGCARFLWMLIGKELRIRTDQLNGMMEAVAGKNRAPRTAFRDDAQIARRVSARILEPDSIADLSMNAHAGIDDVRKSGIQNRRHAVIEGLAMCGFVLLGAKEIEVSTAEEIACIREGGNPSSILQTGIPSDMVEVQVRAHDEMNIFGRMPAPARFSR